ncbi:hypothetical protein AB4Z01_05480 [Inquilinus sp. YAF38]|uniref:hypothetical protein n=1 Tax=Inquilinus sp. YAF38 TaxID=3233084 RepID=UPI003F907C83
MRQYRQHPERFVRDHSDDHALRQTLAGGEAIADAIARIPDEEAAALDQLPALMRP